MTVPCIADLLKTARSALEAQKITDAAQLEAEILLAFCLKKTRTYLYTWPEKTPSENDQAWFNALIQQRLLGKPIAHLIGFREFWGLSLKVTADTLIPRPDTEILIETALNKALSASTNSKAPNPCTVLDLGTGTGAIALALKSERSDCQVYAVDISLLALEVAKQNALDHQLDIEFVHSHWFAQLTTQTPFDLIVSNPPYIEQQDPHLLQGDVRFEPLNALTAGKDGLKDLTLIIDQAWSFLKTNGWLMVEHGYNQGSAVRTLFALNGYQNIETIKDYGNNPRVTIGQK